MKNYWLIIFVLIPFLLVGAGYYYQDNLVNFLSGVGKKIIRIEKFSDNMIEKIGTQISAPPPLIAEKQAANANLSKAGIIKWTNVQRSKFGLSSITESLELDQAALAKAQDMLKSQYFAHESPDGRGPAEVVAEAGYKYIAIGENLALGNFENDEILVQAWMDSPGHRENILHESYREIGVAVVKGIFEGKATWIAVQEFGRPLSACPQINEKLKSEVENKILETENLGRILEIRRQELDRISRRSSEYAQKISEYNLLVNEYNNRVASNKTLVNLYNSQVRAFNACISAQ